jgi:hypothetical protein
VRTLSVLDDHPPGFAIRLSRHLPNWDESHIGFESRHAGTLTANSPDLSFHQGPSEAVPRQIAENEKQRRRAARPTDVAGGQLDPQFLYFRANPACFSVSLSLGGSIRIIYESIPTRVIYSNSSIRHVVSGRRT